MSDEISEENPQNFVHNNYLHIAFWIDVLHTEGRGFLKHLLDQRVRATAYFHPILTLLMGNKCNFVAVAVKDTGGRKYMPDGTGVKDSAFENCAFAMRNVQEDVFRSSFLQCVCCAHERTAF